MTVRNFHLFFLAFCGASLVYWLLVPRRARLGFLTLLSVAFLALLAGVGYQGESWILLGATAGYVCVGYLLASWAKRSPEKKGRIIALSVGLFVGLLVAAKWPGYSPSEPSPVYFLGISYITFRILHYIVDASRRDDIQLDFWRFVLFCIFFPAWLAGPIDRFDRFWKNDLKADIDWGMYAEGVFRLLKGFCLVFLLGAALKDLFDLLVAETGFRMTLGRGALWLALPIGSIVVYFNFAGYTDMAVGVGRLFNVKLCENFNNPYMKPNIQEFWRSWHMSLTTWIQDFVYTPICRPLIKRNPSSKPWVISVGFFGSVITMTFVGIWHGLTWNFLIWGIVHGLALGGYLLYGEWAKARYGNRAFREMKKRPLRRVVGALVTFSFVSLTWYVFHYPIEKAGPIYWKLFGLDLLFR